MKKQFYWIVFLSIILISCGDDSKETPAYIYIDKEEITFEYLGGDTKISLKADGKWQAGSVPDWLSLDVEKGSASAEITVTALSNETKETRDAVIYFSRNEEKAVLKIHQLSENPEPDPEPDPDPELPYIKLDVDEIIFEYLGGNNKIELETNGKWQISNIPDWLSLDATEGSGSTQIKLTASENIQSYPRDAEMDFLLDNEKVTLKIHQKKQFAWARLSGSSFEDYTFVFGKDGKERIYSFTTRELFVNPDAGTNIKEKIFLGNLISNTLEKNTDIFAYQGYTFNPITVFSSAPGTYDKVFIPSKAEQDTYARQIIDEKPSLSDNFFASSPIAYDSHRELHLIGMSNLGIKLDEAISMKSYKEEEMTKRDGLIFSFSHTLFTSVMHSTDPIKEEIKEEDFSNQSIAYISQVSYGRIGLLIIESNNDIVKIRAIVDKIMAGRNSEITDSDKIMLEEMNAYHLYYNNSQKLVVSKGKMEIIEAYKNQMESDTYNVFAFKIGITGYFDSNSYEMKFTIPLP